MFRDYVADVRKRIAVGRKAIYSYPEIKKLLLINKSQLSRFTPINTSVKVADQLGIKMQVDRKKFIIRFYGGGG